MNQFNTGDHVVYPGHGVGKIKNIQRKLILGSNIELYHIEILDSGMVVLVPTNAVDTIGVRPTMSKATAIKVFRVFKTTNPNLNGQTWNVRYRDYMEKIKTGEALQIAEVLRDLHHLKVEKELSFGERKMLDNARSILFRELSLVIKIDYLKTIEVFK